MRHLRLFAPTLVSHRARRKCPSSLAAAKRNSAGLVVDHRDRSGRLPCVGLLKNSFRKWEVHWRQRLTSANIDVQHNLINIWTNTVYRKCMSISQLFVHRLAKKEVRTWSILKTKQNMLDDFFGIQKPR